MAAGRSPARLLPTLEKLPKEVAHFLHSKMEGSHRGPRWFSILFTGNLPEFAGKFIYATITYWNDIFAYAFVLVTDEYPGFSLNLS